MVQAKVPEQVPGEARCPVQKEGAIMPLKATYGTPNPECASVSTTAAQPIMPTLNAQAHPPLT
jgi:hypothetical protein